VTAARSLADDAFDRLPGVAVPNQRDDRIDERRVRDGDAEFEEVLAHDQRECGAEGNALEDDECQADEDDRIEQLARRRRAQVAHPEVGAVGSLTQPVKGQHVPVLADEVGRHAADDDGRAGAQHRAELRGADR